MLKKLFNVLTTLIVVAIVILSVLLAGVRVIGYTPFAILSPSMSPEYKPGDLVYAHKADFEDIKKGDVITFITSSEIIVTHRVDEVVKDEKIFYTKGDANNTRDIAPVAYENVIGVVKFSIPFLGYVSDYITSPSGKYVAIAAVCLLIVLFILPEFFKKGKNRHNKEE